MYVRDLKNLLESVDDFAEVRILEQPTYPWENHVDGVVLPQNVLQAVEAEARAECGEEAEQDEIDEYVEHRLQGDPQIVYLVEGEQIGRPARGLFDAMTS